MNEDEMGEHEREAEQALFREYRDVVGQFRYAVETERRFYLANSVQVQELETRSGLVFQLELADVWVWDIYRPDRFVKSARVITHKDVNIEELNATEFKIPDELALGE